MSFELASHIFVTFVLALMNVHFLAAGAKTFRYNPATDEGGQQAEVLFTVVLVLIVALGVYYRIRVVHGVIAFVLAVLAVVLYESARRAVRGVGLSVIKSESVAEGVVTRGPYAYIRHPFYTSYLVGSVAVLVAFPVVFAAVSLILNVAFFTFAARSEEKSLMESALAPAYAGYRNRTGMFFPRVSQSSQRDG
jgi:protein-S-isoprenylcysteine O-methyltransferase Ste14